MNRRLFIGRLGALLGFGGAGTGASAMVGRRIELQRSPVAGFQYHEGESAWPYVTVGAPVRLAREPGNRYDARAVRIEWNGRKLGYLPRMDNAAVTHMLDSGQRIEAEIVALRESANPWDRVEVAVFLPT